MSETVKKGRDYEVRISHPQFVEVSIIKVESHPYRSIEIEYETVIRSPKENDATK